MSDVYQAALRRQPELRRRAQLQRREDRLEKAGIHGMFDLADLAPARSAPPLPFQVQGLSAPPREPHRLPGHSPRHATGPAA
jgi:hypothetical protein